MKALKNTYVYIMNKREVHLYFKENEKIISNSVFKWRKLIFPMKVKDFFNAPLHDYRLF